MQIGILGTGLVARTLAGGWTEAGHTVTLGSRDPTGKDDLGYAVADHADTVRSADVVVNATPGTASVAAVKQIGDAAFANKVLIDIANAPTPAFELAYPNSSLGLALQEALPSAKVVKTLNTLAAPLMVNPVGDRAEHDLSIGRRHAGKDHSHRASARPRLD